MSLDTQMTLALLQELLMALRANDADGYKSAHAGKLSRNLQVMSSRMPPLDDVVSPMGAAHARALQQRVADFITGGADQGEAGFNQLARDVFRCQFKFNEVYRRWCAHLGWTAEAADEVQRWQDIPTLPVEAFRWSRLHTKGVAEAEAPLVFRTSGTTGADRGEHHVATPGLYRVSAVAGFKDTYGAPGASGAVLFGLLPG